MRDPQGGDENGLDFLWRAADAPGHHWNVTSLPRHWEKEHVTCAGVTSSRGIDGCSLNRSRQDWLVLFLLISSTRATESAAFSFLFFTVRPHSCYCGHFDERQHILPSTWFRGNKTIGDSRIKRNVWWSKKKKSWTMVEMGSHFVNLPTVNTFHFWSAAPGVQCCLVGIQHIPTKKVPGLGMCKDT